MNATVGRAALRAGLLVSFALLNTPGAQAQQIITAVESDWDLNGDNPPNTDTQATFTAGQAVATTLGGADARALTDFGVNKIYARGTAAYKAYATSAWLDSYTVGGAAGTMVDLSFTINVHGAATGIDGPEHAYNFEFYALRGDGWSMSGAAPTDFSTAFDPLNRGDQYDTILLTQTRADGGLTQINARDFDGVFNYLPNGSDFGSFFSKNDYDPVRDVYTRTTLNGPNVIEQLFFADAYQQIVNGVPGQIIPLSALPQATQDAIRAGRRNLETGYAVLAKTSFCSFPDDECGSLTTTDAGIDLTLNFSMMAGSTFSLSGYLFADDFYEGTADFYNTAKMTGISVSQGGSLTSTSGTLVDLGGGSYGYQAVLSAAGAVPEPSAWTLLILGFGAIGGAMRRSSSKARIAKPFPYYT